MPGEKRWIKFLESRELYRGGLSEPHVAKGYEHPTDWIYEIEKQNSDELWEGYTELGGSCSTDYMIGETDYIRKGYGRQIVLDLVKKSLFTGMRKELFY